MTDPETIARVLDAADKRRLERRSFLRTASAAGLAIGGSSLLAACGSGDKNKAPTPTPSSTSTATPSPTPTVSYSDGDIFALALNFEYLEAQFFLHAAFGTGLDASLTKGAADTDKVGTVTGGKKVAFTDQVIAQYAREIANDEKAHVGFLRTQLASSVIAQPDINIDGGATGAFSLAARGAKIVDPTNGTFDPYASDENFLLAAFLLEDIGPTAYRGAFAYMSNAVLIEAAAGIMATESYHAGLIRSTIYASGDSTLIANAGKFSNYRDSLDGPTDEDQGIAGSAGASNVVPADQNAIVYGRTPTQLLNLAFLSASAKVTKGGFFPSGINGTIKTT